jgi:fibronectin-binding autotransporter adhesin
MAGSTISTTITSEVTLGTGIFLNPLTITATGHINGPAETNSLQTASAIYVGPGIEGASILNHGQIRGILPAFDSLSIPAILAESALNLHNYSTIIGQSGIYLNDGGTVTNSGLIAGSDARSQQDYGIRLFNASLVNSGTVYGAKYGVTNWNLSEITNTGTILGDLAGVDLISTTMAYGGTLINRGSIYGKQTGITASQALITNAGTVTGEAYGIHIAWGSTISNSGQITGGLDGVLLLNQQYQTSEDSSLINSGGIAGGYFGLAINFSDATNAVGGMISGQTFGVGVGEAGYFYNGGAVYGLNAGLLPENGGLAVNAGTIRGGTIGAFLFSGSDLTNTSSGYVHGGKTGVRDQGGYLLNSGTVAGSGYGLYLSGDGIGVNAGKITSQGEGIYLSSSYSTLSSDFFVNGGNVYGKTAGVILKNGTVYNLGTIAGGPIGVSLVTGTSLSNSGIISGQKYGAQLNAGRLVNAGTIAGGKTGVEISHGYLFNSGTISGGTYAIYGQGFTLAVGAGEVFAGNVVDKTDTSTLDLTGAAFGTLVLVRLLQGSTRLILNQGQNGCCRETPPPWPTIK